MTDFSMTEAKARLGELVKRAAAGEPIRITKRGKVVAEITVLIRSVVRPRQRIDVEALERLTADMPMQEESAGDFVRRMRDEDRC